MDAVEYGSANANYVEYMKLLDKQLSSNPGDFDALLKKGILSFSPFYRIEEAEAIFDLLVKKYPENVDVYFWFGECLFGYTSNYQKTEWALRKALALDLNRADCHKVLASILGLFDQNSSEVELHYRQAIKLEPSWLAPRKNLAYLLFKRGDFERARIELEAAIPYFLPTVEYPNDPIVQYYEELITGRGRKGIDLEIIEFIKKIDAVIFEKS